MTHRFNTITIKIQFFFSEIEKTILKFVWKHKRSLITKAILNKKNKAGGMILLDFEIDYRNTVIKPVMTLA